MSEEEQRKSFKLKATGSNSFLFTCLQSNCREPCVLRYADKSSSVNMYNAHRHITQSCWLRPNKKPNFSTPVAGNSFETKAKPKDDQPAPRKFVPQHSDDRDFAIVDDDSHAENTLDKVTVETETAEITDVSSSSKKDESSKNLQVPVGVIAHTETERALIKAAVRPGQTSILDYLDIQSVCDYVEVNTSIRTDNRFVGVMTTSVWLSFCSAYTKMPRTIPVRNRTAMM